MRPFVLAVMLVAAAVSCARDEPPPEAAPAGSTGAADGAEKPGADPASRGAAAIAEASRSVARVEPVALLPGLSITFDRSTWHPDERVFEVHARLRAASDIENPPDLLLRARCPSAERQLVALGRGIHDGSGLGWIHAIAAGAELPIEARLDAVGLGALPPACELDARVELSGGRVRRIEGVACLRGEVLTNASCGDPPPAVPAGLDPVLVSDVKVDTGLSYLVTMRERLPTTRRLATRIVCPRDGMRFPSLETSTRKWHLLDPGESMVERPPRTADRARSGCDVEVRIHEYEGRDVVARRPDGVWDGCVGSGTVTPGPCEARTSLPTGDASESPFELLRWSTTPIARGRELDVAAEGLVRSRRLTDETVELVAHVTCRRGKKVTVSRRMTIQTDEILAHYLEPGETAPFTAYPTTVSPRDRAPCEIEISVVATREHQEWALDRLCLDARGREEPCPP